MNKILYSMYPRFDCFMPLRTNHEFGSTAQSRKGERRSIPRKEKAFADKRQNLEKMLQQDGGHRIRTIYITASIDLA